MRPGLTVMNSLAKHQGCQLLDILFCTSITLRPVHLAQETACCIAVRDADGVFASSAISLRNPNTGSVTIGVNVEDLAEIPVGCHNGTWNKAWERIEQRDEMSEINETDESQPRGFKYRKKAQSTQVMDN